LVPPDVFDESRAGVMDISAAAGNDYEVARNLAPSVVQYAVEVPLPSQRDAKRIS
jgi:hypothetical protein